jgi:LmbE family N-acetylglucosaminyl deacetylase
MTEVNPAGIHPPEPDAWDSAQRILVILAHPDDPEFFCGGTIARWTQRGHHVSYYLLTCGDKGTKDFNITPDQLCSTRQAEQRAAAAVLGVHQVNFLSYPDGYLVPDLKLRRDVTRILRQEQPDIVVTCDPLTLYTREGRLNHPDHRAAGQAVLDAVFPAARDFLYFIDLWQDEKLGPHAVREVWVSLTLEPDVRLDVTEYWETKICALYEHCSQIPDRQALAERMRSRLAPGATMDAPRYEEGFRRLIMP